MRPPDFFIIGAMKCGTSTLQTQLGAQPGIFMTTPKEPNFFSDDPVFARGRDWYLSLFSDARPDDIRGEASTHYTKLPTYPHTVERLAALCPAPRLVYMIRDPVARAVSHYIHEWTQRAISSDLPRALRDHPELVDYGRYGMQIAPYVEAFGADAVLLTSLEAFKDRPAAELRRVGAHIGAPDVIWNDTIEAQNVSSQRVRALPLQRVLIDNPVARTLRRTLVPKALRRRVRAARSMTERPDLPDAARARLHAIFTRDRETLERFFPGNPALRDAYPFVSP